MKANGSFEVKLSPEPAFAEEHGVTLSKITVTKRFFGALDAEGIVHMIAVRTPLPTSAGYVAVEQVRGTLGGKAGTFVLQHSATATAKERVLSVTVVPDSGTGELMGLTGKMDIQIVEGKHYYDFEYEL